MPKKAYKMYFCGVIRYRINKYFLRLLQFIESWLFVIKTNLSPRQFIYLASIIVAISSALAVTFLKSFAHFVYNLATEGSHFFKLPYIEVALPIVGILLTVFVVDRFLGGKIEKGTAQIMIAVAKRSGFMPRKQMYAQIITSSLTVGFGGSAGLESPITITGAAFGSNFARNFKLSYKERMLLLACGVASGIAAAFNAPIAGILFAIEVVLADMSVSAFIPLMLSSATGAIFSNTVLKGGILLNFPQRISFSYENTLFYILLGLVTGLVAVNHARLYRKIEHRLSQAQWPKYRKAVLGAFMLSVLIFIFPALFGEGYESIKHLAQNNAEEIFTNSIFSTFRDKSYIIVILVAITALVKPIATGLTLGSGGNGGHFAPALFVGSFTGFTLAKIVNLLGIKYLPIDNFTIVGMAGVLSALFHAPLTAIFLIAEITGGYDLMIPLMIVSSSSFAISKRFESYSLDLKYLANKGIVFTSDKDRNLLTKIDFRKHIKNDVEVIRDEISLEKLQSVFGHHKQYFVPIVNQENKLLGIIDFNDVREELIMHELAADKNWLAYMKFPVTITTKETTERAMQLMDMKDVNYLIVEHDGTYIGYVTKKKIMEEYRHNLKNFRVE